MEDKKMKRKSNFIVLVVISLFLLSVFAFCEDKNNDEERAITATVLKYTGCHEHFDISKSTDDENEERVEYSVKGNELYITIYDEIYNCCDSVLKIDVALENNKIVIYELGDNLCDCICSRDAKYKVSNIPSGHYDVEIAGKEYRFEIDVK